MADPFDQGRDLFERVVHAKRGSRRGWHAQALHEGLCAMMPHPDGDPFGVEQGTHVVGMDALHLEGKDRRLVLGRSEKANAGNLPETSGRFQKQGTLMGGGSLDPHTRKEVDCGPQADGGSDRRRSRFELVG